MFASFQTEMDALEKLSGLFREAIEKEDRIQKEIQLNFVDVVISNEVLNFLTPIPPPLAAREPLNQIRLSISQIYHLIEDVRSITSSHFTVDTKQLSLMLARKGMGLSKEDLCEPLRLSSNQWFTVLAKIQHNG